MANAWGTAFGSAWGVSWGAATAAAGGSDRIKRQPRQQQRQLLPIARHEPIATPEGTLAVIAAALLIVEDDCP